MYRFFHFNTLTSPKRGCYAFVLYKKCFIKHQICVPLYVPLFFGLAYKAFKTSVLKNNFEIIQKTFCLYCFMFYLCVLIYY